MSTLSFGHRGPSVVRGVGHDVLLLTVCAGLAAPAVALCATAAPARAFDVLAFAVAAAAAIVLVTCAWLSRKRRVERLALAVVCYAGVPLLVGALGAAPLLVPHLGVLACVALLTLAVRPASRTWGPYAVLGALALVVAVLVAAGFEPQPWLSALVAMLAWSGAGAAGIVLVVAGAFGARPLLRRVGLVFVTLATAHATVLLGFADAGSLGQVLELAALLLMAGSAVACLVVTARSDAEHTRARLAEAAGREGEMRGAITAMIGAQRSLSDAELDDLRRTVSL